MRIHKKLYFWFIILAGSLWGSTGFFVRWFSNNGISSIQTVIIRASTTVIIIGVYLLFFDRKKLKIYLKDIWLFIVMGICCVTAFNLFYFKSILQLQSMSVASVLLYTSPVFVTIMAAIFFREKITALKCASVVLTFIGCFLVSGILNSKVNFSYIGIIFGIGAGFTYALYSIFGQLAIRKQYHPLTIVFYMWLFGFLFTIPLADINGLFIRLQNNIYEVGLYFLFGLVSAVLPYVFYTIGIQHVPISTASILATSEPCVAAIIGVLFFNEPMTVSLFFGALAIISSVLLINFSKKLESLKEKNINYKSFMA